MAPEHKYTAVEVDDNKGTRYANRGYDYMVMEGPVEDADNLGALFTNAEAQIIAFALNAINRGHELFEKDIAHNAEFRYDGPTEGI